MANVRPTSLLKEFVHPKARWWMKVLRTGTLAILGLFSMDKILLNTVSGRPLTDGETKMLREAFNDSVDYSKMRIHHSPAMDMRMTLTGAAAEAFGSLIAFRQGEYKDDFSKADPLSRFYFMHEATHTWQADNCFAGRKFEALRNGFNLIVLRHSPESTYDYTLKEHQDLAQFGIEQQANIVADYFVNVSRGRYPLGALHDASPAAYQKTLKKFLQNPSYAAPDWCRK